MVWDKDQGVASRIEGFYRSQEKRRIRIQKEIAANRAKNNQCFKCNYVFNDEEKVKECNYENGLLCKTCKEKGYDLECV